MTEGNEIGQNGGSSEPQVQIQPLRTSERVDALAAALAKAQGAMQHPKKNKVAKVPMKNGGTYSYNYADLADVLDALRGPLAANELALVQIPFNEGPNAVGIVTRIMHSSGQWIEGTLFMPCADAKPQTIGSAITYGRRYAASPMAGVASEDDDDGNAAQGNDGAETQRRHGREPAQVSRPASSLGPTHEKVLGAFTELGVTREQLEAHMGGKMFAAFDEAEFDGLRSLYEDVKAGRLKVGDIGARKARTRPVDATASKLKEKFKT